jgi:hypothetical protein
MTSQERAFQDFASLAAKLKGDEKSEAQTFLFHLLEALISLCHDVSWQKILSEYSVRNLCSRKKKCAAC